jgi:hypothetical protein
MSPVVNYMSQDKTTLEEIVKKEMSKCSWCREELELLLKYKDVVKRALLDAVRRTHSCVLHYGYIYDEIYSLIDDEEVATSLTIDDGKQTLQRDRRLDYSTSNASPFFYDKS